MTGTGGSAALWGSPTWTSDPIAVNVGQALDFDVAVNSLGVSSSPTAGLVYLGPLGEVLSNVTLVTAPLTSQGFRTLESTVTIPAGVATVRVFLKGFAPTDLATAGTVKFDEIGLYAQ